MKYKINDFVKFRGKLGMIIDLREISLPKPMNNYTLAKVSLNDDVEEWVNTSYLVKVG